MTFTAILKRTSTVWHNWNGNRRLTGFLSGVRFDLKGSDYVTGTLDEAQVAALKGHAAVRFEAKGSAYVFQTHPTEATADDAATSESPRPSRTAAATAAAARKRAAKEAS